MADLRSYHLGVAIADNLATPSNDTLAAATFLMNYDGTNWDMVRGDATDGLLVNLGANNDVTVTSGAITLAANSGVDIGDVDVTSVIPGTGATNLGKAVDTAFGATDTGVLSLAVRDDALGGLTPAEGDVVPLYTDANGALWTNVNNTVVVSATALDIRALSEATDQVLAFANTAADGSGTDLVPLVDASGHLQVDVLTGGGTDTPTNPVNEYETSAALAAGSTATLTTAEAGGKSLAAVEVWSSVAYKVVLHTVDDAVESTDPIAIGGAQAHAAWNWNPTHRSYVSLTANAGLDAFRVKITNLDDSNAADVYATFHYEDT
jgi:hypothetical protein